MTKMIADKLKNAALYYSVNSGLEKGFDFIRNFISNEVPDGRYDIDGDNVYALVQSYETVSEQEAKWETHRKYIDIQCVIRGREIIGYAHMDQLTPSTEYNEQKDIMFYQDGEGTAVKLQDGCFAVFFPEDAHKPKCAWGDVQSIKKIVVKIKV